MTRADFQANPALRAELRAALDCPAMSTAMSILSDEKLGVDAALNTDAIVSVRELSRRAGMEQAFQALHAMTHAPESVKRESMPDWGTGLTQEQLAAAERGDDLPPPLAVRGDT